MKVIFKVQRIVTALKTNINMELPEKILHFISCHEIIDSQELANEFNEDHQKIIGAVKSLECFGDVIRARKNEVKQWQLTEEGKQVVQLGSHEAVAYSTVPQNGKGISKADLIKAAGNIGFSKAIQQKWIFIDKEDGGLVKRNVDSISDIVQQDLYRISNEHQESMVAEKSLADYKKRKLVEEKNVKR